MNGKEQPSAWKSAMLDCLFQLNGNREEDSDVSSRSREMLLTGLLTRQLQIIHDQNQQLIKLQTLNSNLRNRNVKLLEKIRRQKEAGKSRKISRAESLVSRASSPFQPDSDNPASQQPRPSWKPSRCFTLTYDVRPGTSRTRKDDSEVSNEVETSARKSRDSTPPPAPPPRLTRSGASSEEWRTRNKSEDEKKLQKRNESDKNLISIDPPEGVGLHRLRIHVNENIVTTLDPGFLPPSLFNEIGGREAPLGEDLGNIEVPSWRLKIISPSRRQSAGLENLEDAVFLRRHWKPEENEKRRKRWEDQKLREEQYVELLKRRLQRRGGSSKRSKRGSRTNRFTSEDSSDDTPKTSSFHPNPKDGREIQVDEEIPINIFGVPLPAFTPQDFCLPWKTIEESTGGLQASILPADK